MIQRTHPLVTDRRRLLAGAGALSLASCGRSAPPEVDEAGRVRLRFATDWLAQAEHGGFYQALASGAYDIPLNLVNEGAPVKAVAAFFQKDPQVLIAHPDPALESIADLAGRPILLADASVTAFWVWLKAKYRFTDDQVRKYTFNPAPFLADLRAVQQGYLTSEPYTIEKVGGFTPRVFLLADEGYPSYATMVLAPDGFARDNAEALRSFIAASIEGWRDYLNGDASAANALIRRDNPEMTRDVLDQARAKLKSYALVEGGDAALFGLGAMTADRWRDFFEVTSQAGVYPTTLNWRDAFTLDFLPGRG